VETLLRPAGAPPLVVAHRGASRDAPENTMAAFRSAWSAGVSWMETDVQPTADLVPVLLHDDTVDRTTDGTGAVRALTAREVAALDAGGWHSAAHAGERVPRLADLTGTLDAARSLLLEIKGEHTREQVAAEIDVVRASGWDSRVLLQSFEVPALRHVRSLQPDRPVGLLVEELHDDPVAVCAELGAVTYNPDHAAVLDDPAVVDRLHAAGIAVMVYTVDDPADWARLDRIGVDAVITNTPAEMLAWLSSRPAR
jgi:glycerophosphoryl diester phosphodiesterase